MTHYESTLIKKSFNDVNKKHYMKDYDKIKKENNQLICHVTMLPMFPEFINYHWEIESNELKYFFPKEMLINNKKLDIEFKFNISVNVIIAFKEISKNIYELDESYEPKIQGFEIRPTIIHYLNLEKNEDENEKNKIEMMEYFILNNKTSQKALKDDFIQSLKKIKPFKLK